MNSLWEFLSMSDPNVRVVALGAILLTATSALVGCFTFLDKKSLLGDSIAHAVLPGICLGFLISGTKDPVFLIGGAFITGWLSVFAVEFITTRTRIKEDAAIGLVLSVFFGVGILLLTTIQKSGNASQSGLDSFIFGKAAALMGKDLVVFSVVAIALLVGLTLFFREFTLLSFDRDFAEAIGLPVKRLRFLLTILIVMAVVIGIQAVGVVLMAAMLITPAAAARFWTDRLKTMVALAGLFGALSGLSGAYISYLLPSAPTGPWIVLVISLIAGVSFILAPKKGILSRLLKQQKNRRTIHEENVLKTIYQLGETNRDFLVGRTAADMEARRSMDQGLRSKILNNLESKGYLDKSTNNWSLTEAGRRKAERVVRIHRLWELYLTTKMNIAPDHVHDDAETMEHLITPELEAELEKQLNYPKTDPHAAEIPYQKP
ncbi:MAG: metal ABC transporter permease [Bacteroidetes bacterium]|nr:metal ABC transporter permease [Bacteroidota bacterium]